MHIVDFESDSWLYRIFEIYHVKYTDICSILCLDTFSFHISAKSHVYHVKYTDFSSILYLDTFSVHLSVKSHVYHVNYTDFI